MDIATPTARRSLREPLSALALFAGGLAWIAAFWFPAFYTSQGAVEGYWVFATGWMGFAIFQFAWYANLFMLLGIALMHSSPLWGATFAGVGVLVATQAFWFSSLPTGEVDLPILQIGQGFWFWYGSILLLGVGVFLGSEQLEAEKDQSTKNKQGLTPEPRLQRLPASEPKILTSTSTALMPVALTQVNTLNTETPEALNLESQAAITPATTLAQATVETVVVDLPSMQPEQAQPPLPFAQVPEPELPNFADLTAANEQEYFQLANEQALKPVYTEHLAEDWPPQMSLVVSPEVFNAEPALEAKQDSKQETHPTEPEPVTKTVAQAQEEIRTAERPRSTAAFFDPWKA